MWVPDQKKLSAGLTGSLRAGPLLASVPACELSQSGSPQCLDRYFHFETL